MNGWETVPCAGCGSASAAPWLALPCADAPGGSSAVVTCDRCGLKRLDPRPGPQALSRYYEAAGQRGYNAFQGRRRDARRQALWEWIRDGAAHPCGRRHGWVPFRGALARWAFDINLDLRGRKGWSILEVGAGYGDLLKYWKDRGCEVLGTDLGPQASEAAGNLGLDVRVGTLSDLALPHRSFDAAVLCHSLEDLADPNCELAELARLLKPGGMLHIAVPNGQAVRFQVQGPSFMHLSFPLHFWFFDPANLESILRKHGFSLAGPMRTTTRHHALAHWLEQCVSGLRWKATQEFWTFLRLSLVQPHGGDVLRVQAVRDG